MCIRDSFWSENATRERVYVVQLERSYTEVCAAALFALRLLDARRQRRLVLHAGTQRAARLGAARHLPVGRIKVFFLLLDTNGLLQLAPVLCVDTCLLYTSPSPRDMRRSRMPSSA
eukprot:TRINITY_DN2110_c0_g1_i2.p1 TRINITY_DN2110_c0_g1~~TRINITY_DN2110_c0_g1_i2.p1  ORF type:complete len:116 (+),score=14.74 TRINITY_DN2110_c0_g1_i2:55-402(+)